MITDIDICDLLLSTRWTDKDRKAEAKLFKSKWFDYRALHPVQATYLYGEIFIDETRKIIREHVDNTPPRITATGRLLDWQPLKEGDILEPPASAKAITFWKRKTNALIRARQWADKIGAPYEVVIRAGLRHWYFGRYYIMENRTLPDPSLFNGEQCQEAMLQYWIGLLESRIQFSEDSNFVFGNGHNFPDKLDHERYILDQIARRAQPKFAIKKFTDMGLIRPESVAQRFGSAR